MGTTALGDRATWLMLALGLAAGMPVGWGWYALVGWPGYSAIEQALWLTVTNYGIAGLATLLLAPFLDRRSAPIFRGLGHRASWVALGLAGALAVFVSLALIAALLPQRLAVEAAVVGGILAMPVVALLWISVDALRIELRPGRAQATLFGAQFLGAVTATALVGWLSPDGRATVPLVGMLTLLLALGLAAILLLRDRAQGAHGDAPVHAAPPLSAGLLIRPWTAFFARHGTASGLLLAAVAFYALGASAAEHLGKNGYILDLLDPTRPGLDKDRLNSIRQVTTPFDAALSLLGGFAGMIAALRLAPARSFAFLQCAVLALVAVFLVCKLTLGFTVMTVALLYAIRVLVVSAAYVIYAVVAARLTAPPHTAGQYALLGAFVGLFWLSEVGMNWLGPMIGSYATAGVAIAAALAALACMRQAARIAHRTPIDRG